MRLLTVMECKQETSITCTVYSLVLHSIRLLYYINEKYERDIIIVVVENAKETSSDTGMHNRAITMLHARTVDVSWKTKTYPHGNNLIPVSVPLFSPSTGYIAIS